MIFLNDETFAITKRVKTEEGYLLIEDCRLARPGVLTYRAGEMGLKDRDPLAPVRVYKPADVLFSTQTLDSLKTKPVTLKHPGRLDSKNVRQHQRGLSKEDVREHEGYMTATLLVTDEEAVRAIEQNKTPEISLGARTKLEEIPGVTPQGEKYDFIATAIVGNHIALVERGRCGRECRLSDEEPETIKGSRSMITFTYDGLDLELTEQGAQIIKKEQEKVASLEAGNVQLTQDHEAALEQAKSEATKLVEEAKSETSKLQAELDDAKTKILSDEELDARVEARSALLKTVTCLVQDFDPKGKSNEQIKKEVVASKCADLEDGDSRLEDASYVSARFDALSTTAKSGGAYKEALGDHAKGQDTLTQDADSDLTESEKIRRRKLAENRERNEKLRKGGE